MLPLVGNLFYRLQERLLGRRTFAICALLQGSQWWPRERLEELQLERLRTLVAAAYTHTPYWRTVMQEHGIAPGDIRSLADLQRFPLLSKEQIRAAGMEMVWKAGGWRVQLARSSGSTNEPLEFYTCSQREAHINAARIRGHGWVGMHKGEREMYFWGSPVEITKQDRIKQLRDWLISDGFTNGFNISAELAPSYIRAWLRFRPKCIFSYPSSLDAMVTLAERQRLDLLALKDRGLAMIITTAEPLAPSRERLHRAFGVPVYDSYGLREVGLIAHDCEHQAMHCAEEQLILETIDPTTLEPTSGEGELVVTNLVGHVMPMLRYRTGDIVKLSDSPCPCGRTLRQVEVTGGRACDFVVTSQGVWLSGYAFAPYLPKNIPGIVKLQVQQERLGHIRLLLATSESFTASNLEEVRQTVRKRLQCDDELEIELVNHIPPCPSGKHRIVISKVAQELRRAGQGNVSTLPQESPC